MTDAPLTTADVVLAAIGVSLVLGVAVSVVSSVSAMLGLVGASVPASGLLGYALFINPPSST
jgi:hypothetical protein